MCLTCAPRADPQHIEVSHTVAAVIRDNAWRWSDYRYDLRGADLRSANLYGAELDRAKLEGAKEPGDREPLGRESDQCEPCWGHRRLWRSVATGFEHAG
ncbi:pentapeptide repeat-containing protein [Nocardia vinacea]|uniref:pentapeptide repeat-containing protein n=1 Tax=Nocardia vinacea TaxID=96468 RepID=UPI003AF3BB2B